MLGVHNAAFQGDAASLGATRDAACEDVTPSRATQNSARPIATSLGGTLDDGLDVAFHDVGVTLGGRRVLSHVTCAATRGTMLAILGPSGQFSFSLVYNFRVNQEDSTISLWDWSHYRVNLQLQCLCAGRNWEDDAAEHPDGSSSGPHRKYHRQQSANQQEAPEEYGIRAAGRHLLPLPDFETNFEGEKIILI